MKVLRNILLTLSLAATCSANLDAMKRKHQNANVYEETNILVLPEDLIYAIAQYLDGKAFSAFTLTCKSNESILNKISVRYLWCVNCAEAVVHGNVNLTRRYLQNTCGTWLLETAETKIVREPEYIDNYLQPKLIKFLLAGEHVYSMAKIDAASDAAFYLWLIKGSADNGAMLIFASPKIAKYNGRIFRSLSNFIYENVDVNLQKVMAKVGGPEYNSPGVVSEEGPWEYITKHAPSDSLAFYFHTSDDKPHGDVCFKNTTEEPNRERTRFDYFCLNALFIVAAKKNLGAIIEIFLKEGSICKQLELPTLIIAADMTTDDVIKQALEVETNRRNNLI